MSAGVPPSSTGSVKLDALKQSAAAADPTKMSGVSLYSRFAFAGAVCCSVTHGAFTPVDVYVFRVAATPARAPMAAGRMRDSCDDAVAGAPS
jgi:solute carrier family 25 phosphate transporter 3